MTIFQSDYANGRKVAPMSFAAGAPVQVRIDVTLPAGIKAGDIIEAMCLPAGTTIADAVLVADKGDSNATPALALDVGLMSGEWRDGAKTRDCGSELFAADTTARAGGVARMTRPAGFRIDKAPLHRSIGIEVATAPATQVAGAVVSLIVTIVS
ncbi:hypothetical protein CEK28_08455 [Xenophilus sp. AP218F]|nr:hypothetical protein CEK28_08455 [Xenophilus sp. AP218F]